MRYTLVQKSAGLLAALLFSFPSFSQVESSDSAFTQQELIPISIQGIRVNNKTPYAVSNLNQKEIQDQNTGQDIPFILNSTPSVIIHSDAGAGVGYTGIRIRGTDAARINFTINGIPVNDAESQVAIFINFPDLLSSTNSIQIQRGVGSSTNGAGAFGGSVNISNLEQKKEAGSEVNNSIGSFNTWKHTIKASTGLLKGGFQFDARASKISSDGYIDRSASDLKSFQFIGGWQSKDEKTSLKFNLFTGKEKTDQAWNGVLEDSLQTNRTYNGVGMKRDGSFYKDQTDNYQQDYYQLFFNHVFHANWKVNAALFLTKGKGYYNEYKNQRKFLEYGLPNFISLKGDTISKTDLVQQRWLDNDYYGGLFSLAYEKAQTQVIFGGSITKYEGEHYGFVKWAEIGIPVDYRWYLNSAFKNDYNFYLKGQQRIGQHLYAFADLQYRNVLHDMNGFRQSPDLHPIASYQFFNPKFGLSYLQHYRGGQFGKAYFSYARANKEPNRKDYEESPLEFPNAEKLNDFEAGYHLQSAKYAVGVNLYYMSYVDQLVYSGKINDYGTYSRINVEESYRRGIELSLSFQPLPALGISGNFTFSQNKILNFNEFIDDYDTGGQIENSYTSSDISFSPNLIASGMVSYQPFLNSLNKQEIHLDILGKFVGRQYLDNTSNRARSINPYGLIDLRLRYNLQTSFIKNIGLSLVINNVLNKKYEANGYTFSYQNEGNLQTENYYFPQAGINILFGINLTF